ncbi:MAG: TraB/GumN family protein, partial [Gaiellaceae bacterium]
MKWHCVLVAAWLLSTGWLPAHAADSCPPGPAPVTTAQLDAAEKRDRGFLWEIERDGRKSYLYGTLHVGRPEWMRPGPRVSAAFDASEVLALEIDPTDAGVKSELALTGTEPPMAVPRAIKARLARQMAAACLPENALGAMAPAMQAVLLGVFEARWAGLDPSYAQEQALAKRAHETDRSIVSLETVALQKQVLVPAAPKEALAMIEGMLDQLESGTGRRVIARLADA